MAQRFINASLSEYYLFLGRDNNLSTGYCFYDTPHQYLIHGSQTHSASSSRQNWGQCSNMTEELSFILLNSRGTPCVNLEEFAEQ